MEQEKIRSWYEQYRVGIFRYALSILKRPALAEDVLQETFVRLWLERKASAPIPPGRSSTASGPR